MRDYKLLNMRFTQAYPLDKFHLRNTIYFALVIPRTPMIITRNVFKQNIEW